jgi:hypothetical protein
MNATERDREAEAVLKRTGLQWPPPRDAAAIGRPSSDRRPRSEAAAHARRPLGLGVPADDRHFNIDEDDAPIDTSTQEAEVLRWRETSKTNRAAWLSDVDILILRAVAYERRFTSTVTGEILGETMGELASNLRMEFRNKLVDGEAKHAAEIADLRREIAELRGELRGAASERNAPRILRP